MGKREYPYRCQGLGFKSPAQKAAEELEEELHLEIDRPELLGNAEHFCRVDVNSEYQDPTHHMAFFVSRMPNEGGCKGFSREKFKDGLKADWNKGHSFQETRAMAHVPVENLLRVAVPVDDRDIYCEDIDGTRLLLRPVLKKLLRNKDFCMALQLALKYYDRCVLRRPP